MAITIIDLPDEVARATEISWTMETSHGRSSSPFTGHGYSVRGNLERWRFVAKFKPLNRADMQALQSFFLKLEGNLHSFRMGDPSQRTPLGDVTGVPRLNGDHAARTRVLSITAAPFSTAKWLAAGDWIQVGNQMTKVVADVNTNASGKATVKVWPYLWSDYPDQQLVEVANPTGVFHFDQGPPSWTAGTENLRKRFTYVMGGAQTVLAEGAGAGAGDPDYLVDLEHRWLARPSSDGVISQVATVLDAPVGKSIASDGTVAGYSDAMIGVGNSAIALSGWVRQTEEANAHRFGLSGSLGTNYYFNFTVDYNAATANVRAFMATGPTTATTSVTKLVDITTDWYFVYAEYDPVAETLSIDVNNSGSPESVSTSGVTRYDSTSGSQLLRVFAGFTNLTSGEVRDGQYSSMGFFDRPLTPAEQTILYNGGPTNGPAHPAEDWTQALRDDCLCYYPLSEHTGLEHFDYFLRERRLSRGISTIGTPFWTGAVPGGNAGNWRIPIMSADSVRDEIGNDDMAGGVYVRRDEATPRFYLDNDFSHLVRTLATTIPPPYTLLVIAKQGSSPANTAPFVNALQTTGGNDFEGHGLNGQWAMECGGNLRAHLDIIGNPVPFLAAYVVDAAGTGVTKWLSGVKRTEAITAGELEKIGLGSFYFSTLDHTGHWQGQVEGRVYLGALTDEQLELIAAANGVDRFSVDFLGTPLTSWLASDAVVYSHDNDKMFLSSTSEAAIPVGHLLTAGRTYRIDGEYASGNTSTKGVGLSATEFSRNLFETTNNTGSGTTFEPFNGELEIGDPTNLSLRLVHVSSNSVSFRNLVFTDVTP